MSTVSRTLGFILTAEFLFGAASFAGCGSSPNGSSSDAGADVATGAPTPEAGSPADATLGDSGDAGGTTDTGAGPVEDTGTPDVGSLVDTGVDAGPGGGSWIDATSTLNDAGVLGAICPPVDAAAFKEAPHAPLPAMAYDDGGVLTAPQIVTFTFPETPSAAALQAFGAGVVQSPWFAQVTADYCEGEGGACIVPGPAGVSISLDAGAAPVFSDPIGATGVPTSGVDLPKFVNDQIGAAIAAGILPGVSANAVYTFYFPPTSTVQWVDGDGGVLETSCTSFGGYHWTGQYTDGTPIVHAVVVDCGDGTAADDLDWYTTAASHELIEATTDPYPSTGWYVDLESNAAWRDYPWSLTGGYFGETGDNCTDMSGTGLDVWTLDGGAQVQRIWSTSQAALGHNPCIPVPAGEAYYQASTDMAVYVAKPGVPFTIDVSVFSDAPRGSWRLDARDWTYNLAVDPNQVKSYLQLDFQGGVVNDAGTSDYLCANNGTSAKVTATLLADPATDGNLSYPFTEGAIVSADVAQTQTVVYMGQSYPVFPYHWWPFLVMTQAVADEYGISSGASSGLPIPLEHVRLPSRRRLPAFSPGRRVRPVR